MGTGNYQIGDNVWKAIGKACAESGSTIPSSFGCRVPNIATERHHFIAESWFLFTTFLGPVVLRERFNHPEYYLHFVEFVKLVNACIKMNISAAEIDAIEQGCAKWVLEFERYVSLMSSVRNISTM
jgi:hypothetical protein